MCPLYFLIHYSSVAFSVLVGQVRVLVSGVMTPLSSPPLVVRMCPPLTTRNLHHYSPRVAVGNAAGSLQLINAATGLVLRDVNVHTFPVRCVSGLLPRQVHLKFSLAESRASQVLTCPVRCVSGAYLPGQVNDCISGGCSPAQSFAFQALT